MSYPTCQRGEYIMSSRRADIFLKALCITVLFAVLSACAGSSTSPTDSYDQVNETLNGLERNYESENVDALMKMIGRDYDLDYRELERSVNNELDDFTGFDVDLVVDRVSVDNDTGLIFAETHWTKRRISLNTGREFMINGETVFIFRSLPNGDLALRGMKGDPIFGGW
jgi:hypothetical protein